MLGKSGQKVFRYLGAIALASTATLTAIAPKVQAAVLTYNFDTWLFHGYFKIDKLSQSEIDEIIAQSELYGGNAIKWKPIIEGQLFYKIKDYGPPPRARGTLIEVDPESIPSSIDLAASDRPFSVSYYYGRWSQYQLSFEGMDAKGSPWQRWVYRVPPTDNDPEGIEQHFWGWNWRVESFTSTISKAPSSILTANRVDSTQFEDRQVIDWSRGDMPIRSIVTYELVSDTDVDGAQPIPEPMTVAGTALALAGIVGLKYKKKSANLSAKN